MISTLYRDIADKIERQIRSGRYEPGAALPTEKLLEQEFQASRITIRQALALLKRRGILYSRSGLGTLVRQGVHHGASVRMTGSLSDLNYYAEETQYRSIGSKLISPPREIAERLGDTDIEAVYRFCGIRSKSEVGDFAYEEVFVPKVLARDLHSSRLDRGIFYPLLEEEHGFSIAEVRQEITAVTAPTIAARELRVRARAPMLKTTRTYLVHGGQPVEVAISYFDTNKFEYVMTMYRD